MPPAIWAAGVIGKAAGKKDPGIVVVDEVVGTVAHAGRRDRAELEALAGGIRCSSALFDIWKPFPVRRLERLPGGGGIVCDDLMAGMYGALVLLVAGCFNLY